MKLGKFIHVLAGPLCPGVALIVKCFDRNFSGNINHITVISYHIWLWALGLLENGTQFKVGAPGGPWQAPRRLPRHSKKVNFKSNVIDLQKVIKSLYGKGLGLWVGPRGAPRRPGPDSWRPPKSPHAQRLGSFEHLKTKPSGNHQNIKGKWPLTLTLTDWTFVKISLWPRQTHIVKDGALSHKVDLLTYIFRY